MQDCGLKITQGREESYLGKLQKWLLMMFNGNYGKEIHMPTGVIHSKHNSF